jgi:hypothetical protein
MFKHPSKYSHGEPSTLRPSAFPSVGSIPSVNPSRPRETLFGSEVAPAL